MTDFEIFYSSEEEIKYVADKWKIDEEKIYSFLGLKQSDFIDGHVKHDKRDIYEKRIACLMSGKNFEKSRDYMIDYIDYIFIEQLNWDLQDLANYCVVEREVLEKYMNKQDIDPEDEKTLIIRVMSLGRGLL